MTDSYANILNDFNGLQTESGFSSALRRENDGVYIPSLRNDHAALYRTLLFTVKPRRILEAGTLYGYSSILAAETLNEVFGNDFRIDTVEVDQENALIAAENIEKAGFSGNIRIINGDAEEVFSCLEGPYDLVFLDCSKSSYKEMFPDVKRLLRQGGLLLADDVCYHGKLEGAQGETVPHKHRTIVNSLRDFLQTVSDDNDFAAFVDKMDDGMLVAVKK